MHYMDDKRNKLMQLNEMFEMGCFWMHKINAAEAQEYNEQPPFGHPQCFFEHFNAVRNTDVVHLLSC